MMPSVLPAKTRDAVRNALGNQRPPAGRNDFEGYRSERVYSLLARGQVFADLCEHSLVLSVLDQTLAKNYLLTAALSINLHPGETPQAMHYDDICGRPCFGKG